MVIYTAERFRRIRVVVTGGGTGGHTYPALTTIRTLGAARVLAGPAATPDRLREEIMMLLDHPDRRQQLANTARQHGRPDAAAAVASAPIDAAGRYAS